MSRLQVGELFVRMTGDTRELDRSLKRAEDQTRKSGRRMGLNLSTAFKATGILATAKLLGDFASKAADEVERIAETGEDFSRVRVLKAMGDEYARRIPILGRIYDAVVRVNAAERESLAIAKAAADQREINAAKDEAALNKRQRALRSADTFFRQLNDERRRIEAQRSQDPQAVARLERDLAQESLRRELNRLFREGAPQTRIDEVQAEGRRLIREQFQDALNRLAPEGPPLPPPPEPEPRSRRVRARAAPRLRESDIEEPRVTGLIQTVQTALGAFRVGQQVDPAVLLARDAARDRKEQIRVLNLMERHLRGFSSLAGAFT